MYRRVYYTRFLAPLSGAATGKCKSIIKPLDGQRMMCNRRVMYREEESGIGDTNILTGDHPANYGMYKEEQPHHLKQKWEDQIPLEPGGVNQRPAMFGVKK